MPNNKLNLQIVSQERKLFSGQVELLTAPGSDGELTILPFHAPFFCQLANGELRYQIEGKTESVLISTGFLHVTPDNAAVVIVDSAQAAREISLEKAQAAVRAAKETMMLAEDQRELLLAEAALKKAMLEIKVAQRLRKSNS